MNAFLSNNNSSSKRTQSISSSYLEDNALDLLAEEIEAFSQLISNFPKIIQESTIQNMREEKIKINKHKDEISKKIDSAKRFYKRRSPEFLVLERLERQFSELKKEMTVTFDSVTLNQDINTIPKEMEFEDIIDENELVEEITSQQKQSNLDVYISISQLNTIETQKLIKQEERDQLLSLESSTMELESCLKDMHELVLNQQKYFDRISNNISIANSNIENGTKNIRSAKGYTITEQLKSGLTNPIKLMKIPTMFK